jgi:hypothetical protein
MGRFLAAERRTCALGACTHLKLAPVEQRRDGSSRDRWPVPGVETGEPGHVADVVRGNGDAIAGLADGQRLAGDDGIGIEAPGPAVAPPALRT